MSSIFPSLPQPKLALSGLSQGLPDMDMGVVRPFAVATVTGPDGGVGVTISLLGTGTAAGLFHGTLSGAGLIPTGFGTYSLDPKSAAAMTAELRALSYTPAATSVPVAAGAASTLTLLVSASDAAQETASGTATVSDTKSFPVAPPVVVIPPQPSGPLVAVSEGGKSFVAEMEHPGSGSPDYLQWQHIAGDAAGMAMSTTTPNVFLHSSSGDDAIQVSSGRNVLDGGTGSNYLTGTAAGAGTDTFFVDARALGGGSVWDTIVNFHAGDMVTYWGFEPGISTIQWADGEGATTGKGLTMHSNISGVGIDASMTLAGLSTADMGSLVVSTGHVAGGDYLAITHL
jgi:hypothetical protein